MSFILDALRKSETERQRQSAPSIADARYRVAKPGRSRWLVPGLFVVLLVNAALVAYLLLRTPAEPPVGRAVVEVPLADARPLAQPSPARPPAPMPPREDVRPLATEVAAEPEVPAVKPPAPAPAAATATAPATVTSSSLPATGDSSVRTQAPAAAASGESLPSLQTLLLGGVIELPPLRVDIHVYSDEPGKRFVFINMNKYREGDQLTEGPTVESITTAGTILSYRGNRFTLERE